jgi:hypothetical protein
VGIILYFVWKDSKPKASKDVCIWAVIGFAIGIIGYIVAMVAGVGAALLQNGSF